MNRPHDNHPLFSGIIPPLVTPLTDRDTLDHAGLVRLVEHVIAGGVHGIFILGTSGEAPSLGYRLRRELIAQTCKLVGGRVPVLVGVTDTAFVESIQMARVAADAGAAAVVLTTPYYFPAGQTELLRYIKNIAAEMPLPIMLYNMPTMTKVWIELPTLKELTQLPQIIGLKDSGGDLAYFRDALALKADRPDWSILIGPENHTIQAVTWGADGGVNGGANIFPGLFVEAYQAALAQDEPRMRAAQQQVDALQAIYEIGKYASRHIKAIKCALSLLGVCDDFMAEPFNRFQPPERARVETAIARVQAGLAAATVATE